MEKIRVFKIQEKKALLNRGNSIRKQLLLDENDEIEF